MYIANWERLVTKKWLPSYVSGRSFRKFGSADPGLLYVWSAQKIPNKAKLSVTNCIGFYDYRNAADTVTAYSAYTQQTSGEIAQPAAAPVSKPSVTTIYRTTPANSPAAVQATERDTPVKSEEPKKDYRYVQELLDKIAELEKSSDSLSMEEIAKLRTEVDNAIEAMQEE